ncbi:FMN-binding negative transcriptional regulator [Pelagerythrobacter rhizovicinus]|uniref:FMN-binding negative transcriptional regulator n=1 Tax=Pelagerythrobacter rhizovicinus TaxID=2268576 RepID=A0A4V1QWJ6_9SPHN|nr:FMN-binding negative transcriptional regulator [Pelagerythrobacter rhizovicinus]RXZ66386.1 FMN-binding negative transcriptional regulator [Pelagerythrobacter rhizovicinus]
MNDERRLYAPRAYAADDPRRIVREHPFALLITTGEKGPWATSVPIYFETDDPGEMRLIGHMARNNPHARALQAGDTALAVFAGPHAYISASWYRERPTVPTWNYVTAHVRGALDPIDDDDTQLRLLDRVTEMAEQGHSSPWTMAQAPEGRVDALLPHIRSFRIAIDRIEGVTKLSQTHPAGDRMRVIDALEARGWFGDQAIAALMRDNERATEED